MTRYEAQAVFYIQGVPEGFARGVNGTCAQGTEHPNGLICSLLNKGLIPKEIR